MPNTQSKMFESFQTLNYFEYENILLAKKLFEDYKKKRIIIGGDFEDNKWFCSDEYSHTGLYFSFNAVTYKKYYENLFDIPLDMFTCYVKTFVIFSFGKIVLNTLHTLVNDIKRIIKTNPDEIYGLTGSIKINTPAQCIDFFSNFILEHNEEKIEHLIDCIDSINEVNYVKLGERKRTMAQFESYFLFNDIMNDFWNSIISKEDRLFYYPLYLWWKITGVIPLRPREFLLTSRNCLCKDRDEYFLTLRRNNLKGSSSSKIVKYKIEEDYFDTTYQIPTKLGDTIQQYLDFTSNMDTSELKTLFVTDSHYKQWNRKTGKNNRYFTYVNLNRVLKYFYDNIICNRYHLKIIYDNNTEQLNDNEICYLHLGDTRHLALINIMAEGGTPLLAMQLAGHHNMEMAAHYYSNISSLIDCRTYRQFRKISKGDISYNVSHFNDSPATMHKEFVNLPNNAQCYSEEYRNGSIKDCINSIGKNGEIGNCLNCMYYKKSSVKASFYDNDRYFKKKIQEDCKYLDHMVQLVRTHKGNLEDIGSALLRLQTSTYNYQKYCEEKLVNKYMGEK